MSSGVREWRVDYFSLGSSTAQTINNIINLRITEEGISSKNKVEIYIKMDSSSIINGEVKYKADETFKIYAAEGEVDITNDDHLMGVYTILNINLNAESRHIKVTLMDKTYDVLSKIYAGDLTATAPEIIENVYKTVTNSRNALIDIASQKSDGSSFEDIEYFVFNKTAYEIFNELSQPNYTGDDRTYLFYVDENERLIWKYPGQTPESLEFKYGVDPVIDLKFGKSESNVVSMIIFNAGEDKNGNDYVDFYLAPNADTIKGRMLYQEMRYLSKNLKSSNFWDIATNEQIQTELDKRARDNARKIVHQIGTGLWQANINIRGTKFRYGDLYYVEAPEIGFPKTLLRLNRIVHNMNKDGWKTDLMLEQDAESLS